MAPLTRLVFTIWSHPDPFSRVLAKLQNNCKCTKVQNYCEKFPEVKWFRCKKSCEIDDPMMKLLPCNFWLLNCKSSLYFIFATSCGGIHQTFSMNKAQFDQICNSPKQITMRPNLKTDFYWQDKFFLCKNSVSHFIHLFLIGKCLILSNYILAQLYLKGQGHEIWFG